MLTALSHFVLLDLGPFPFLIQSFASGALDAFERGVDHGRGRPALKLEGVSFLESFARLSLLALLPITQPQEIEEPGIVVIESGGGREIFLCRGVVTVPEVGQPRGVISLSHRDIRRTDL